MNIRSVLKSLFWGFFEKTPYLQGLTPVNLPHNSLILMIYTDFLII
jgi:hypothetical protein